MSYKSYQGTEFAASIRVPWPSITGWNRLEGQPRSENLERSLSYEICDALWMLTCQLRTGELTGEDAGSPVSARIKVSTSPLDQVRIGAGPVEPLDDRLPIEARAEREHPRIDLRFALEGGRLWRLQLDRARAQGALSRDFFPDFLAAYPVDYPAETDPTKVDQRAHQTVLELYSAAAGRAMDGRALYVALREFLASGGPDPLAALASPPSGADGAALANEFKAWWAMLRARYSLDGHSDGEGWQPEALSYSLSCSAPGFGAGGRVALRAEEHCRGNLDWYSFDDAAGDPVATQFGDASQGGTVVSQTHAFVPTALRFAGMPAPRLWEFENRKTNFGKITAYTTDLARLMLVEFGLVFGNDWFLFPLETQAGRIVKVDGLVVTDSFGGRTWVPTYGSSSDRSWERWVVFANAPDSRLLLMADAIGTMLESAPIEEVTLFRDEVANMVFGVERRIPLDDGRCIDGFEAFQARRRHYERLAQTQSGATQEDKKGAPTAYRLMIDELPENWIPFVPVQMAGGDNREIQLQRAAMLRMQGGSEPERVLPRTRILRPDPDRPYFVHEEQVPRTGVRITMTYQRTRHHSGRPVLWCGRTKRMGSGEGSSGLMFDRIEI